MFRAIATLLGMMLLFCPLAFGQATGIIVGTVADDSGAVITNVTVTITNKATGVARTATTNAEGYFSAPALPAGDYQVKAEATGFKT
jgi:carboxypeptidase family protein